MVDLPNLVGWGGHYYDSKTFGCIWNRLKSHSYSLFYPITSIMIPSTLIFICYLRIFTYARSTSNKVLHMSKELKSRNFSKSFKLAKGLFLSFMLFSICWLPHAIVVMVDYQDRWPRPVHMFSLVLAHFNSSLNPIFFALSSKNFKKGYRNFLQLILFKIGLAKNREIIIDFENSNLQTGTWKTTEKSF